jgi:PAS domain S-box-containing protein
MIAQPDDDDVSDVSVSVDAESQVRLSEGALPAAQRWALADGLDALPDAVFLTDLEGRILFLNRAALELFNVDPPEVLGRPLVFFVAKADCAVARRALREARAQNDVRVSLRMRPRHSRPAIEVEVRARVEASTCAWVVRERAAPFDVEPEE